MKGEVPVAPDLKGVIFFEHLHEFELVFKRGKECVAPVLLVNEGKDQLLTYIFN